MAGTPSIDLEVSKGLQAAGERRLLRSGGRWLAWWNAGVVGVVVMVSLVLELAP